MGSHHHQHQGQRAPADSQLHTGAYLPDPLPAGSSGHRPQRSRTPSAFALRTRLDCLLQSAPSTLQPENTRHPLALARQSGKDSRSRTRNALVPKSSRAPAAAQREIQRSTRPPMAFLLREPSHDGQHLQPSRRTYQGFGCNQPVDPDPTHHRTFSSHTTFRKASQLMPETTPSTTFFQ